MGGMDCITVLLYNDNREEEKKLTCLFRLTLKSENLGYFWGFLNFIFQNHDNTKYKQDVLKPVIKMCKIVTGSSYSNH